jgi:hypothetical protein
MALALQRSTRNTASQYALFLSHRGNAGGAWHAPHSGHRAGSRTGGAAHRGEPSRLADAQR